MSPLGVPTDPQVKPAHRQLRERLSALEGAAFDRAYTSEMVKEHEKDIQMYEKAQAQLQNEQLKAYATETLPRLEAHLDHARTAQKGAPSPK